MNFRTKQAQPRVKSVQLDPGQHLNVGVKLVRCASKARFIPTPALHWIVFHAEVLTRGLLGTEACTPSSVAVKNVFSVLLDDDVMEAIK